MPHDPKGEEFDPGRLLHFGPAGSPLFFNEEYFNDFDPALDPDEPWPEVGDYLHRPVPDDPPIDPPPPDPSDCADVPPSITAVGSWTANNVQTRYLYYIVNNPPNRFFTLIGTPELFVNYVPIHILGDPDLTPDQFIAGLVGAYGPIEQAPQFTVRVTLSVAYFPFSLLIDELSLAAAAHKYATEGTYETAYFSRTLKIVRCNAGTELVTNYVTEWHPFERKKTDPPGDYPPSFGYNDQRPY